MRFFDTSAFVKRYVIEPHSDTIQRLLSPDNACLSRLATVEAASAVHRRRRSGELTDDESGHVLSALNSDCTELAMVEVSPEVCDIACTLLARHPLRALDAIQLASALVVRQEIPTCEFVVFDARLAEAARAEGLTVWP